MRHIGIGRIGRSRHGDDSSQGSRPHTSTKPSRGIETTRTKVPNGCFKPAWTL
jgi:hypothetical protein